VLEIGVVLLERDGGEDVKIVELDAEERGSEVDVEEVLDAEVWEGEELGVAVDPGEAVDGAANKWYVAAEPAQAI
jgi:hypothetical protein